MPLRQGRGLPRLAVARAMARHRLGGRGLSRHGRRHSKRRQHQRERRQRSKQDDDSDTHPTDVPLTVSALRNGTPRRMLNVAAGHLMTFRGTVLKAAARRSARPGSRLCCARAELGSLHTIESPTKVQVLRAKRHSWAYTKPRAALTGVTMKVFADPLIECSPDALPREVRL